MKNELINTAYVFFGSLPVMVVFALAYITTNDYFNTTVRNLIAQIGLIVSVVVNQVAFWLGAYYLLMVVIAAL